MEIRGWLCLRSAVSESFSSSNNVLNHFPFFNLFLCLRTFTCAVLSILYMRINGAHLFKDPIPVQKNLSSLVDNYLNKHIDYLKIDNLMLPSMTGMFLWLKLF